MSWLAYADEIKMAQSCLDWLREQAPLAKNLTSDSRKLVAGDIFIAYPGDHVDGRQYITTAIAAGAAAILWESENYTWSHDQHIPHWPVPRLKAVIGLLAALFYGQPSRQLHSIGITGTNGKTTTSQWLGQALTQADLSCAVVGTLGMGLSGRLTETGFTTPDAITLQRELAQLQKTGARACAMEVSSIGIEEGRINGIHFDTAVFTNFTQDHLDYHGDMAAYARAKEELFAWPGLRTVVINADDALGQTLLAQVNEQMDTVVEYSKNINKYKLINGGLSIYSNGVSNKIVLVADQIRASAKGTAFTILSNWGRHEIDAAFVGGFNVSNALAVLGALLGAGISYEAALKLLNRLEPVSGRMEKIAESHKPLVVIDYAHTPDALSQVLDSLRPLVAARQGQLWCVFGCGGDRDPIKRAMMGEIAARLADHVIITSDNPRSEDPQQIVDAILTGIDPVSIKNKVYVQLDRAAAILYAVNHAQAADVILLAGKGHENYQEIHGKRRPFSDHSHALLALRSRHPDKTQLRAGRAA